MLFSTEQVEELIIEGYKVLTETWHEIEECQTLIDQDCVVDVFTRDGLRRYVEEMSTTDLSSIVSSKKFKKNSSFRQNLRSNLRSNLHQNSLKENATTHADNKKDKESTSEDDLESHSEKVLTVVDEAQILKNYYKINALRPVNKMEPGRLPYRHDQFRKMEQYRKQWRENPAPGDKSHRAERMEIRQQMAEQDVPRLRVVERTSSLPEKRNEFRI